MKGSYKLTAKLWTYCRFLKSCLMISLQPIQTTFTCTNHLLIHTKKLRIVKSRVFCKSKSNESESEAPLPEDDTSNQELLAKIAMLQTQKVRLTDYLDERSAYLTKFGEEANAEIDKIGEDAMKGLDEASERIMGKIESQMQAFEEFSELNRQEIETNENILAKFEDQIDEDRNEGLFFKSLKKDKDPVDKAKAKEETEKIKEVTKKNVGSTTRRNIYLALIGLMGIAIADSFITSLDWRKVAVLGAILVALLTQYSYEQELLSETKSSERKITEERKK